MDLHRNNRQRLAVAGALNLFGSNGNLPAMTQRSSPDIVDARNIARIIQRFITDTDRSTFVLARSDALKLVQAVLGSTVEAAILRNPVAWRWRYQNLSQMNWLVTETEPKNPDGDIDIQPLYVSVAQRPSETVNEQVAIRAAQIDERWRQAMRDLRELEIAGDGAAVKRRIFDLIMMGPALPSTDQGGK